MFVMGLGLWGYLVRDPPVTNRQTYFDLGIVQWSLVSRASGMFVMELSLRGSWYVCNGWVFYWDHGIFVYMLRLWGSRYVCKEGSSTGIPVCL